MVKGTGKWAYSDLAKMEVVAYGCHRKLNDELSQLFADEGIETFQLVEYFFLEPVYRNGNERPVSLFFPFIRRLFDQSPFRISGQNSLDGGLVPRTKELRKRIEQEEHEGRMEPRQYLLPFDSSVAGQKCFKLWTECTKETRIDPEYWFEIYSDTAWKKHEDKVICSPKDIREMYRIEFDLVGKWWMNCAHAVNTVVGGYPIASNGIMYGYFVIVWPEPKGTLNQNQQPDWGNIKYEDIVDLFDKHSKDSYVPTLALLHNSIAEDRVYYAIKEVEDNERPAKEIPPLIRNLPIVGWPLAAEDVIERGIASLWQNRIGLLSRLEGEDTLKQMKDTLLFRKYNVASPGMVKQIQEIIQRAPHLHRPKEEGDNLPTALVYGEAGSGKDTMAQLIPLFTAPYWEVEKKTDSKEKSRQGYFGSKPHIINMSALKPNMLFGPLFLGMTISDPRFQIPSILLQSGEGEGKHNATGVFILDELNSLDADLQGVLLRVLENGEVRPLFGIEAKHVAHLIIGIVNENPKILTKESETKKLEQIKDFTGEFLGSTLYEFFIKGRRLRPDLFYRLSRGLYLELPPLRDRREDIPILFYFECRNAVLQELKNGRSDSYMPKDVYVELKAYESLMHPSLDWSGNVRQLQALATQVAIEAVKSYESSKDKQQLGFVRVSDKTVREVLAEESPKIFPETPDQKNHNKPNKKGRQNG